MSNLLQVTPLNKCLTKIIDYRGKTPKKLGSSWSCSGYRVISANNVKFDGLDKIDLINYADEELYKKWMKEDIKKGYLLLTSEAPSGQVMLWDSDEKIVLSQRLFALQTNEIIYNKYLKYYLQSNIGQKEIFKNNSGSTVFGISAKTFSNILIRHPTYPTQVKIGDLLYSIDKNIELNNLINASLEAVAKTLYDYWFVQFDFPNINGKPYKTSDGRMVYDPSLKRNIPEGWKVCELGNFIKFKRGISYESSNIQEKGAPFINLNSFTLKGEFKFEGTKYYNGKFKPDNQLKVGELVVAITDVTRNADIIGKAFVIPDVFNEAPLISCDVASISSETFGVAYLEKLFNSNIYHKYIKHFASGTLVLHLDLNGVNWFKTVLPPDYLLKEFELHCASLFKQRDIVLKKNIHLKSLRDWLLPMLMSGQINVK